MTALALVPLILWDLAWLLLPASLTGIVAVLGLPVMLLPGALIVKALGGRRINAVNGVFAVGLSVIFLYLVGLGANFLPQLAGQERPLDTPAVWVLFNFGYLVTFGFAFGRRSAPVELPSAAEKPRGPWWIAPALSASAVAAAVLAVLGAVTLNNGGSSDLAIRALILVVVVAPAGFLLRHRVGDLTLLTVIAATTLALLLATSMRSWYASGQDLQHEFQVFMLAHQQGVWDVSTYRDPYNACLSLTLLPVSLTELLRVPGEVVFKVVNQMLFCVVPLTLFTVARPFLGRGGGYLVAFLFVGLPTFSVDVPFITRQQIAFVFVALALAALFTTGEGWVQRRRGLLFGLMAGGVIVSHYSTAYLFVAAVIIAFTLHRLYLLVGRLRQRQPAAEDRTNIPVLALLATVLMAGVWFGPVTQASGDLVQKLGKSAPSILELVADPGLALQSLGQPNAGAESELEQYVASSVVVDNPDVPALARELELAETEDRPVSAASRWVASITGVDPSALLSFFYYGVGSKLYLLGCGVGTLLLLFSRRIRQRFQQMPVLYPIWAFAAAFVVGLQVLLPGLAADYGIPRAFMQAFLVLGIPMVVAVRLLFSRVRRRRWLEVALPAVLLVVYSGLAPQLTGGLHRQLSLENAGSYYGTVYPTDADTRAVLWVGDNIPEGSKVNFADFAAAYGYHPTYPYDFTAPGLFPFQVKRGDYVLLAGSQTEDHVVYTFGSRIGLKITPEVYASSELLYSSGTVQLFRKL
ncbi:hypothetical protein [Kineosporia babensis]|uniref:Uncharacterized protein n=1 Tax=Kineosporia babensis TaxID=499548 RepID=A0A9X1STG8_9ACTN|nr:hypothetical protein [Kineosporia babensis]MCD5311291.1 hypothetical protein [Kineosporia babensis]